MAIGAGPIIAGLAVLGGALLLRGGKKKAAAGAPPGVGGGGGAGVGGGGAGVGGETVEQGENRLTDILLPWLNAECLAHIMGEGNSETIAREYVTHLGNHLISRYRDRTTRMSVDAAVEATRVESGELCGTYLPPGWTDVTASGEAGLNPGTQKLGGLSQVNFRIFG